MRFFWKSSIGISGALYNESNSAVGLGVGSYRPCESNTAMEPKLTPIQPVLRGKQHTRTLHQLSDLCRGCKTRNAPFSTTYLRYSCLIVHLGSLLGAKMKQKHTHSTVKAPKQSFSALPLGGDAEDRRQILLFVVCGWWNHAFWFPTARILLLLSQPLPSNIDSLNKESEKSQRIFTV